MPLRFEAGDEVLTNHGSLGVVGQLLARLPFGKQLQASTVVAAKRTAIDPGDVATAYLGLPAYDEIEGFRTDPVVAMDSGLDVLPSSPPLRQQLNEVLAPTLFGLTSTNTAVIKSEANQADHNSPIGWDSRLTCGRNSLSTSNANDLPASRHPQHFGVGYFETESNADKVISHTHNKAS